jgi:AraC family transcriptional activator of pobA
MEGQSINEILGADRHVRFKSLDRFVSVFGTLPKRLNEPRLVYLLLYIRKGTGYCYIDNDYVPLQAGSFLLVNPFSFLQLCGTNLLLGHVILFTEDYFSRSHLDENLLYKVTYQPGRKAIFLLKENEAEFDFIKASFAAFGLDYRTSVESELKTRLLHTILYSCILYLHKLQLAESGASYDSTEQLAKSRVVEFIQLLNRHFKEENNLDFYGEKMFLSVKALGEVCKKGIGWGPKAILQAKLFIESRRLLIFDPRPVAGIAMELGFNDTTSFARFFSEYAGISPKEFREQNKVRE